MIVTAMLLSASCLAPSGESGSAGHDVLNYSVFMDVDMVDEFLDCMTEITFLTGNPRSTLDLHLEGYDVYSEWD